MIARITGKIISKNTATVILDTGIFSYEVFLPQAAMQRLDQYTGEDGKVSLITYYYLQVEPAKSTPVLIGFLNEIEKDFFLTFITVSGIGPRAALKAINQPISLIANAIYEGDMNFLKSLPGIGQQKARDIIAKLQNKVGKFGLIKDEKTEAASSEQTDIMEEALEVLMQLEYKKSEATLMLKKALERNSRIQTTEELLNEVYKQKKVA